jgi:hypothetical protein
MSEERVDQAKGRVIVLGLQLIILLANNAEMFSQERNEWLLPTFIPDMVLMEVSGSGAKACKNMNTCVTH